MGFDRNEVAIRFAIEAVVRNAWGYDSAVRRGFEFADEVEAYIARTAASAPAAGDLKEPFSGRLHPRPHERVVVRKLGSTDGILAHPKHLSCRRAGAVGVVTSSVPGHGEDAWFVKHEDGSVGVYMVNELAPAPSPAAWVPSVGDVVTIDCPDNALVYHEWWHGAVGVVEKAPEWLKASRYQIRVKYAPNYKGRRVEGWDDVPLNESHVSHVRRATSSERAAAGLPVDESAPAFDEERERDAALTAWASDKDVGPGESAISAYVYGWLARARVAARGGAR